MGSHLRVAGAAGISRSESLGARKAEKHLGFASVEGAVDDFAPGTTFHIRRNYNNKNEAQSFGGGNCRIRYALS